MSTNECACPNCSCEVTGENDIEKDGKHYCSNACADGHPDGAGCCGGSCSCGS